MIMLYFLFWLIVSAIHAMDGVHFKYFIFLTHWGFIAWNSYLVLSTVTITAAALGYFGSWEDYSAKCDCQDSKKAPNCRSEYSKIQESEPGCCSLVPLDVSLKLQWALFLIGGEYAVVVSILYWAFYTDSNSEQNLYSLDSLNLHAINGIIAVVEIWLSGIPVRICHALYSIGFGCVYILFTVLYYAAGGRDSVGHRFIYPFLDYSSNAKGAVSLAVSCAVFLVGGIHILFFLQYKGRKVITDKIQEPKSPTVLEHI
jgi:hypothetical protein